MIKRTFMCLIRNINSFFHTFCDKINAFARFLRMSCVSSFTDDTSSDTETASSYNSFSENIHERNYDDEFSTNYMRADDILESSVERSEQLEHSEQSEHSEQKQQGCFVPIQTIETKLNVDENKENPLNESTLSQSRHPTWMVVDDNE